MKIFESKNEMINSFTYSKLKEAIQKILNLYKIKIHFYFILFLFIFHCSSIDSDNHSKPEPDIYYCSIDPEVSELMFFAMQQKDLTKSNEILLNLISIRPNCIDIYQILSSNYAMMNDMHNFQKYSNRAKFLQTEYELLSGKFKDKLYGNGVDKSIPNRNPSIHSRTKRRTRR